MKAYDGNVLSPATGDQSIVPSGRTKPTKTTTSNTVPPLTELSIRLGLLHLYLTSLWKVCFTDFLIRRAQTLSRPDRETQLRGSEESSNSDKSSCLRCRVLRSRSRLNHFGGSGWYGYHMLTAGVHGIIMR